MEESPLQETIERLENHRTASGALSLAPSPLNRDKERGETDVLEHLESDELIHEVSHLKRHQKVSIVERLRQYLTEHPTEIEYVLRALVKQGKVGNVVAIKELLDRIDGKVAERHKIDIEAPVKIIFVPAEELLGKPPQTAQNDQETPSEEKGE